MVLFTIMSFEPRMEPSCSVLRSSEYSSAAGNQTAANMVTNKWK